MSNPTDPINSFDDLGINFSYSVDPEQLNVTRSNSHFIDTDKQPIKPIDLLGFNIEHSVTETIVDLDQDIIPREDQPKQIGATPIVFENFINQVPANAYLTYTPEKL